jgi:hypothetical protein
MLLSALLLLLLVLLLCLLRVLCEAEPHILLQHVCLLAQQGLDQLT